MRIARFGSAFGALGWIALVAVCCAFPAQALAAAAVADPLPELALADAESGSQTRVADLLKGSAGVLVYMQTSCAACRRELGVLKDLRAKYTDLKVIAISVDAGTPDRVARYKEHFGFDFPFLHDPDFKTPELFGFSFTPAAVFVGKDGKIASLKGGYRPGDEAELEKLIVKLTAK